MLTSTPEIRQRPATIVLTVTRKGSNGTDLTEAAQASFAAINDLMRREGLFSAAGDCVGVCPDDPSSMPPEGVRYMAGYTIVDPDALREVDLGEAETMTLEGGRYAVFTHTGSYGTLHKTWRVAYREWLPASGEKLRSVPPFEIYIDDPGTTPEEILRTEICVPIQ